MTAVKKPALKPNGEVYPGDLSKAQHDLLLAISGRGCAWQRGKSWRPKGHVTGFLRATGDSLIAMGLAEVKYTKGPMRLELNYKGEGLALEIKRQEQAAREARPWAAR